ncbi:LAMI_0G01486g1_1 [Lachancea mirantina]|uniref:Transcription initiation factor TFIID subunit 8 n=1 Tax=Lachancea mirantina TaxID=1230905 RepID=A0A1G4K7G9_9SACH|nr:LAMI_0G01486g1_1 [Lachancea mirantina]
MSTNNAKAEPLEEPQLKPVRLKKLPTLDEVSAATIDNPLQSILGKAIAVQLKAMNKNTCMSQFAFENVINLVEENLSDMLMDLHKMANIQRRHRISKKDLVLILQGYDLSSSDLMLELERSNFVRSQHAADVQKLGDSTAAVEIQRHKFNSESPDAAKAEQDLSVIENDILGLVPPSKRRRKYVPKWLPEFPPDHTYRFTAMYNRPITDERQMRKQLVEEAKSSEKALLHLVQLGEGDDHKAEVDEAQILEQSRRETEIVFLQDNKRKNFIKINDPQELMNTSMTENFNVEQYARNRIGLVRKKIQDYENRQLRLQEDPFVKASVLVSPFAPDPKNCKQVQKEIKTMLNRSYTGFLESIPILKKRREEEKEQAEKKRREKLEEVRKNQEEKRRSGEEIDVLDLNNLRDDMFFDEMDSSESENENNRKQDVQQDGRKDVKEQLRGHADDRPAQELEVKNEDFIEDQIDTSQQEAQADSMMVAEFQNDLNSTASQSAGPLRAVDSNEGHENNEPDLFSERQSTMEEALPIYPEKRGND